MFFAGFDLPFWSAVVKNYSFPTLCRSSGYEQRSTNSAPGYFSSKITSQQQKVLNKLSSFIIFWWLAPESSKNYFVIQKLLKNQEPVIYYEIESKVKYWFRVSMWLSKHNYKRISRNASLKYKYIADVIKCWYQQKSNDMLPNYHFLLLSKKLYKNFQWIFSVSRVSEFCMKKPISSDVNKKVDYISKNNVINPILTRWQHSPDVIRR